MYVYVTHTTYTTQRQHIVHSITEYPQEWKWRLCTVFVLHELSSDSCLYHVAGVCGRWRWVGGGVSCEQWRAPFKLVHLQHWYIVSGNITQQWPSCHRIACQGMEKLESVHLFPIFTQIKTIVAKSPTSFTAEALLQPSKQRAVYFYIPRGWCPTRPLPLLLSNTFPNREDTNKDQKYKSKHVLLSACIRFWCQI